MRLAVLLLFVATPAFAQPVPADPPAEPSEPPAEPPPPPPPPPAPEPARPAPAVDLPSGRATAGWNDGFFIQSADGRSKLQVGGYMQYDARWFPTDGNDPHVSQFLFRAVRPELKGTLFDHFDFRLLTDFGNGKVQLQDAYVDVHYIDEIQVRLGKTKVPFGLERLQRDIYTTFVERGLPSLLTPNRVPGVEVFGLVGGGVLEYEVGVFDVAADNASGDTDITDHKQYVARAFVRPFAHGEPALRDLGIGAGATYGDERGTLASPDVPAFTTQGQTTFFAYKAGNTSLMDTAVSAGTHWRATAQGYYYVGSFGVLGEYVRSQQHVALGTSTAIADVDAWQGLAQWVITGERASYNSVTPAHAYGAFDIAARYGELRLADSSVFGAGLADSTRSAHRARSAGAGVDWFANKGIRFALDVERTWYWLGATAGADRPAETSIVGRVQTVF